MRYLMLICIESEMDAPQGDVNPQQWIEEMNASGARLIGDRLRPPSDATTVRVRDGETLITDGPYAETKEMMGGFDVIEAADLDEAIAIAAKHPMARYGMIEIRPFWVE